MDAAALPSAHLETPASARADLAAAFRLAALCGFHEGICNHFSLALDDGSGAERYLINRYGVHWSRMTPDDLLLIDGDGTVLDGHGVVEDTARFIHVAGHRANPRHKAIFHTHMPYATALTMVEGGRLEMAHQTACRFFGRIAYEPRFGGLALDAAEGDAIAERAAREPDADIVFLAHHGVVVGAPSVALAFDELYYLERACRQQVLAQSTGLPLKTIDPEVVAHTAAQIQAGMAAAADDHFTAMKAVLAAQDVRSA